MPVSQDLLSIIGDEATFQRWNVGVPMGTSVVVTFSFPDRLPEYVYEEIPEFQAFSEGHKTWVRQALDSWSAAGGISFVEVPASIGGQLTFSFRDMTGQVNSVGDQLSGYAYFPGYRSVDGSGQPPYEGLYYDVGGDAYFNAAYFAGDAANIAPGVRGYAVILHEIGHALGLKHPFGRGAVITPEHDNTDYTIMSYTGLSDAVDLGTVDREAIRYLYGTTDLHGSWNTRFNAVVHRGHSSDEILVGLEINDIIYGHRGDDLLLGKQGNDRLFDGFGDDTVLAGSGRDFVLAGRGGVDTYDGGAGIDRISYANSKHGVWVDLKAGTGRKAAANGDEISGFEKVSGSAIGDDRIWGSNGANVLNGLGGDDRLFGRAGRDRLFGGDGADRLDGGRGNDFLRGGSGPDVFVFGRKSGDDVIADFQDGIDTLKFSRGNRWTVEKLMALAVEDGNDVVFGFLNGDSLRVKNATLEQVSDDIA